MRLEAADVRASLSAEQVIFAYGLKVKRRGSQYRLSECPRCRHRSSSEAIAIDAQSGSWLHHGCERPAGECSGDILDLVAACEGLDTRRDFRRVITKAAELAGLADTLTELEREQRVQQAKERARQQAVADLERLAASRSTAASEWDRLSRRSPDGEEYLRSRALDPDRLIALDVVRFSRLGPAVAIRDADGQPMSMATRQLRGEPKVLVLKDHSTKGTMVDAVCQIEHAKPVIVTEGVADSLTARLAWPEATVLGANGAGNIPRIVEAAITRIKLAQTCLLLVPHDDDKGITNVTEAGRIAIAAGLDLHQQLFVVDLPAKDLNAAWSDGWRPRPLSIRQEVLG